MRATFLFPRAFEISSPEFFIVMTLVEYLGSFAQLVFGMVVGFLMVTESRFKRIFVNSKLVLDFFPAI